MKDTVDSSSINQTLTALDNYVLLGKSGLRVSPLSLGTMVCSQGSHVFRGNGTSRAMRSLKNSSSTLDYYRPLANNGYGKDFGNYSGSILSFPNQKQFKIERQVDSRTYCLSSKLHHPSCATRSRRCSRARRASIRSKLEYRRPCSVPSSAPGSSRASQRPQLRSRSGSAR